MFSLKELMRVPIAGMFHDDIFKCQGPACNQHRMKLPALLSLSLLLSTFSPIALTKPKIVPKFQKQEDLGSKAFSCATKKPN